MWQTDDGVSNLCSCPVNLVIQSAHNPICAVRSVSHIMGAFHFVLISWHYEPGYFAHFLTQPASSTHHLSCGYMIFTPHHHINLLFFSMNSGCGNVFFAVCLFVCAPVRLCVCVLCFCVCRQVRLSKMKLTKRSKLNQTNQPVLALGKQKQQLLVRKHSKLHLWKQSSPDQSGPRGESRGKVIQLIVVGIRANSACLVSGTFLHVWGCFGCFTFDQQHISSKRKHSNKE